MAIDIRITNSTVSENASVLGGATIESTKNTDLIVRLDKLEVTGQATILNDIKVKIMDELKSEVSLMDKSSVEYKEIQEILEKKQWDKNRIIKHLVSFSEGVLASVLGNYLTTRQF